VAHNGRQNADDLLAAALATGATIRDGASLAGIGERTAHRRVSDPSFRARVARMRARTVEAAMGRLTEGMVGAADTLRQLLEAESETVRLGAARSVLEFGVRLRETVDFEARLAALEGGEQPEDDEHQDDDTPEEA
jgi:hypothetical protein